MSTTMQFGDEEQTDTRGLLGRASDIAAGLKHPVPAFFHLLFKVLAIMTYMFGTWVSSSFVNIFVVCVLLLAFDFWTVKNVTGRLMVGLRWWSEVRDDGSTEWKFEAHESPQALCAGATSALCFETQDGLQSTTLDIGVFWLGLILPALVWFFFGLGSLFRLSFDWLLLIATALALSFANIIGYVRCKKDAKNKINSSLANMVTRAGMNNAMGRALTSAAGSAFGI